MNSLPKLLLLTHLDRQRLTYEKILLVRRPLYT
jgi:hypothetical protein